VAISLWRDIRENPYFDALVGAVTRHIGEGTGVGLRATFGLSDEETIRALVKGAGGTDPKITVHPLDLKLPILSEFIPRHVRATPMEAGFSAASPEKRRAVVEEVSEGLVSYDTGGGACAPFRTYRVQAVK
jgi:hypothetical protein